MGSWEPVRSRSRIRRIVAVCILTITTLASLVVSTSPAAASTTSDERAFLQLLNDLRESKGLDGLVVDPALSATARSWSGVLAHRNGLAHDPGLRADLESTLTSLEYWTKVGENVGYGHSTQGLHDAFVSSSGHYRNMIGDYNEVGIGVVHARDRIWVTVRFAKVTNRASGDGNDAVLIHRSGEWHIRHTATGGPAEKTFEFGASNAEPVIGDWNGDGVDTVGVREGNRFSFRNANTPGAPDISISYGRAGDQIYVGDWNGDGRDTLAVRRGRTYFIRNDLRSGPATHVITYGLDDDVTYAGDWNGNGRDTLAVRRGRMYHIRNSLRSGVAHRVLAYGTADDNIIIGDWDGRSGDSFGVRRGNVMHLRDSLSSGPAQTEFSFGAPDDAVYAGDF